MTGNGCTFDAYSTTFPDEFSLLNSDNSPYDKGPALSIDPSTGNVTFDRQYAFDYDVKIQIKVGADKGSTNAFNVKSTCSTGSTTITDIDSSLDVQTQTYEIDGNQPSYTFGEKLSSNSECAIDTYEIFA